MYVCFLAAQARAMSSRYFEPLRVGCPFWATREDLLSFLEPPTSLCVCLLLHATKWMNCPDASLECPDKATIA